ncbi:MAG: OmpA family protein [Treponema sp.]|jgi:outer membrane protein OmpA-like peptidoglycan-associated protein|nr:OmpA family protein [Treponema sp.]
MPQKSLTAVSILFLSLFFFLNLQNAAGEVFEYQHNAGDRYRILSIVREEVYLNRKLSHRAEILNRIAVEVTGIKNGRGVHRAVFQTSERATYAPGLRPQQTQAGFHWSREYESVFERDRLGYLSIDRKYYMPVVRNVPVFPGRDLKPGDTWNADGHEMHDFRDAFGIEQPYRIPFTAFYAFLGDREWKGKMYPAFSVKYRIITSPMAVRGRIWPERISGSSDQIVYWDIENGHPVAYEETFSMSFELSDRNTIEYRGSAEAEVIESEFMDKEKFAAEIKEEIKRLDIADVEVKTTDEGVSLSLEDIRFYAETNVMLPGEQEKLDKIAEILKRFPERDIVVAGHAALGPSRVDLMQLSKDRAKAITDYLLAKNVRTADRIVMRGYGTEKPVAPNTSEEGRRKNRRVEITILEN